MPFGPSALSGVMNTTVSPVTAIASAATPRFTGAAGPTRGSARTASTFVRGIAIVVAR
jgi:hypothetical protein